LSTLISRRKELKYIARDKDMGPVSRRIKVGRKERISSYSYHKEQQCENVV
jgi:hypothetical protein